jgi:hypothetical protein
LQSVRFGPGNEAEVGDEQRWHGKGNSFSVLSKANPVCRHSRAGMSNAGLALTKNSKLATER